MAMARSAYPLGRARDREHPPVGSFAVTLGVLLLGVIVIGGRDPGFWYLRFGLVPARFWEEQAAVSWFWQADHWFTPFTSIFVHLDWIHLFGNLAFFWLFARQIEQRIGWCLFLTLVAGGGILSTLASAVQFADSASPIIGASGATAVLLGAFVALYPTARLGVILPLGLYLQLIRVPGLMLIGTWLLIQVLYSVAGGGEAPIAWWSHIAGFLSGLILAGIGRILKLERR